MRSADVRPEQYYGMAKSAQADLIWDTLFVRNTPLSEATRGVVAVLSALGLDPAAPDLREARAFFQGVRLGISRPCARARAGRSRRHDHESLRSAEVRVWDDGPALDSRFNTPFAWTRS